MAGNLQEAFNLIVQACNDPNIGYSQGDRYSIKLGVPYITHCDCSSLIAWALSNSGFLANPTWFTVATAIPYLLQAGFTQYPAGAVEWEAGDIVYINNSSHHHMEMVYQSNGIGGVTMGAHDNSSYYTFAQQVSINSSPSSAGRYEYIFKSSQSATFNNREWIQTPYNQSRALNEADMYNNAILVTGYLSQNGFTWEAIAGILGNMEAESAINPNRWQGDTTGTGGYGLVQWTPASKIQNWLVQQGYNNFAEDADMNGNAQMRWIVEEMVSSGEWLPSSHFPAYHYSYDEFKLLTNVDEATKAWLWQFERAGVERLNERLALAHKWFNLMQGFPADAGGQPPTTRGFIDWELRRRLVKPF